ncbi:membrane protein [methanotrophic bacterial endosymbiont of Bathymodiolus sp.]|nr:membrane protein [methanotrophic bacterial endosymbiont of Bathymodiolus sp.]
MNAIVHPNGKTIMLTNKNISTTLLATSIILGSGSAFAAEESITSIVPTWPLLAIVAFIFIFRKQLNCIPPINLEEEPPVPKLQEQIITTPSKPEEPSPAILQDTDIAPTEVTPAATATNETIIDLKDDSEQCQGSTAKVTRCKRKTTLEDASVTIDGITYLLTACRQHNTDKLKPYSGLIK